MKEIVLVVCIVGAVPLLWLSGYFLGRAAGQRRMAKAIMDAGEEAAKEVERKYNRPRYYRPEDSLFD